VREGIFHLSLFDHGFKTYLFVFLYVYGEEHYGPFFFFSFFLLEQHERVSVIGKLIIYSFSSNGLGCGCWL
jgi:hypothetical protein